jgi:hypothetical protein
MNRRWFGIFALSLAAATLFSLASCARNQHLTSIKIQPSAGGTFLIADSSLFFDFKAFGTYIHPPHTADITDQVNWQTDTPQVVQVTSAGVVSPNLGCGLGNVFATFKDGDNEVVSNSVPVTVDGPASEGCPQSGATSSLSVSLTGTGTVTSSPAGISCGTICAAQFSTGTTVTLTAAPTSPATAVTWGGCDTSSATGCSVLLEANRIVSATFN